MRCMAEVEIKDSAGNVGQEKCPNEASGEAVEVSKGVLYSLCAPCQVNSAKEVSAMLDSIQNNLGIPFEFE